MKLKPFQRQDYSRLALVPGGILAHEPGLGKTWAGYVWAMLKIGFTHSQAHTLARSPGRESEQAGKPVSLIKPNAPVLIVEPGDLHQQFVEEGRRVFRVDVTALDSQATFLRLSRVDPQTGQRRLPPGFYMVSYTQLGLNGVAELPNPYHTDPATLMQFYNCTLEQIKEAFDAGKVAADAKGYYKLLNVARSADAEEIHKAYRSACKKYHPDVSTEPDVEVKMKLINRAYEVLSDPDKRGWYDRTTATPPLFGTQNSKPETRNSEPGLLKAKRTFDELTEKEQLEVIQEFFAARHKLYSQGIGEWHSAPPIRCIYQPTLADLCQDCFAAVIVDEGTPTSDAASCK